MPPHSTAVLKALPDPAWGFPGGAQGGALLLVEDLVGRQDAAHDGAVGKQPGAVFLGGQRQADGLAGQAHALQAHPAVPGGSAQMPHLGVRDADGRAVAGGDLVGESIAVAVDPHPLRLVGEQLGDASQAAVDEDKGVAAQDQVQDDLLDELERGLPVVGRLLQQLIQRMVGGRGAAPVVGAEELQRHLRQALGDDAGAGQDRGGLERGLPSHGHAALGGRGEDAEQVLQRQAGGGLAALQPGALEPGEDAHQSQTSRATPGASVRSRARDSAMRAATMPSILLSGRSLPG